MAGSEEGFEYVFAQEVRTAKVERYHAWSDKLRELAGRQPGFVSQERRLVEQGPEVTRFETILKFDTAEHCINWLDNPERRRLLNKEEEEAGFAFEGHGNWDGYGRWLTRRLTKEPAKWKINLLVLLTLFPTVMALTPLLRITLKGVSFPSVMLISNALCVGATSWVLVPMVSGFYTRWLEDDLSGGWRAMALGSVLGVIALFWLICEALPGSLW